jgi:hypothetical protein
MERRQQKPLRSRRKKKVLRVAVKHSGRRGREDGTVIVLSSQNALSPVNRAV